MFFLIIKFGEFEGWYIYEDELFEYEFVGLFVFIIDD